MGIGIPGKVTWEDLGGGLSQRSLTKVTDREMAVLTNLYPWGTDLKTRKGLTRVNSEESAVAITGISPMKTSSGTYTLKVGLTTGLGHLDGDTIVVDSISDGRTYSASTAPWKMKQFRNTTLACRAQSGTLKSVQAKSFRDAGIAAPGSAPTIVEGAAGDLATGAYQAVVTFFNTDTGAESNPSVASGILSLGASKTINWSGIPISGNPHVNARRLYRTYVNNPGEYFLVDTITDNVTTTYTADNVTPDDLGQRVSFTNGLPPPTVNELEIWNERCWVTDGQDVYYSEFGLPEAFSELNVIPFHQDDGHEVTTLLEYGGSLVVAKTNRIDILQQDGVATFNTNTLSDKHGCVSPRSMVTAEGLLFWFAGDGFYRSVGDDALSISAEVIQDIIDAIPEDRYDEVCAVVYPFLTWYVVSVPQEDADSVVLVYNYKHNTWAVFKHAYPSTAPSFFASVYDADGNDWVYAAFPSHGHIYRWFDGFKDYNTAYTWDWLTGGKQFGEPGLRNGVSRLHVLCNRVPATVEIRLHKDAEETASVTRNVSLYAADGWRIYALPGVHGLAKYTQIGMSGSCACELTISGLSVEYAAFARRGRVY